PKTLGVALYVADVPDISVTLANRQVQRAGLELKLSQEDGASKLLAIAAAVRVNHVAAEFETVPPTHRRDRVAEFVLPILEVGRLRGSGRERPPGRDGHNELGAKNEGIKLRDRRGQLKLQPGVIQQPRADLRRIPEFRGISAPLERSPCGGKSVSTHR